MVGHAITARVTDSAILKTCNGRVWHLHIEPSGTAGTVIIYDNATEASGTVIVSLATAAGVGAPVEIDFAPIGLKSRDGLFIAVSNCIAVVQYT
jgi:hypothetical protein